jgi:hypothetical protein
MYWWVRDRTVIFDDSTSKARLAQSAEHQTLNLVVVGSSPTLGEFFFLLCSSGLFALTLRHGAFPLL